MWQGMKVGAGQHQALPGCGSGGPANLERVRYFSRQLVTPDDLTQEQDYFRSKLRRHNRLLHGWGVVCGLEVVSTTEDWTVCIQPGYALGPQGDEILVDRGFKVDLRLQGLDGNAAQPISDASDPWCSTVSTDLRGKDVVYLAVAYSQVMSRPVRVQHAGCGCDGSQCEYSRIRDGFQVRVLDRLPASYVDAKPPEAPWTCPETGVRQCPDCVSDPWVVLAKINVVDKTITQADIDNVAHRRYAVSFGNFWTTCAPSEPEPPVTAPFAVENLVVRRINDNSQVFEAFNLRNSGVALPPEDAIGLPTGSIHEIEVQFSEPPDKESVRDGVSFIVRQDDGVIRTAELVFETVQRSVRWRVREPVRRDFTFVLVGIGSTPITHNGQPLDGEAVGLPSGDGTPGGNFALRFRMG